MEKNTQRTFKGQLSDNKALDKQDFVGRFARDFNQRQLKGYLKGHTRFHKGYSGGDPICFPVDMDSKSLFDSTNTQVKDIDTVIAETLAEDQTNGESK